VPQSRRLPERLGGSSTEMEGRPLPSPLGGSYLSHRVDLSELQVKSLPELLGRSLTDGHDEPDGP
jgi:CDP-diacylglycerol pyrophosphatase